MDNKKDLQKVKNVNTSKWKLLRVIYDYDGIGPIEGAYPEDRFVEALEEGRGDVCWIIGTEIPYDGHICVRVELEGRKENLEHVLDLVNSKYESYDVSDLYEIGW